MTITYTLDGERVSMGLVQTWNDMGWHILTLTVESITLPQESAGVGGAYSEVGSYEYPESYGESVTVEDINCNNAMFTKVGDTCSAYIKVSFDYIDYPNQIPFIAVNIGANNYQAFGNGLIQPIAIIEPLSSIGIYRPLRTIEEKYYSGSLVRQNPNLYQMLLMQNGSLSPITVNEISTINNRKFTLLHRTTSGINHGPL